jgi:hypothetical protein
LAHIIPRFFKFLVGRHIENINDDQRLLAGICEILFQYPTKCTEVNKTKLKKSNTKGREIELSKHSELF